MTDATFDLIVLSERAEGAGAEALGSAMVLDMEYLPRFRHKPRVTSGRVTLPVADFPFAVSVRLAVAGFGDVHVYADNAGEGYRAADVSRPMNFVLEAAESRLAAVTRAEAELAAGGSEPGAAYGSRLAEGASLLEAARRRQADAAACAAAATAALAQLLHAGELLALERGRRAIAAGGRREGLRFGCNAFGYTRHGQRYAELFRELLNFATLPFYRAGVEPEAGRRDFSRAEAILAWAERDGLAVKGHPLIWLNLSGMPDWLRGLSPEQARAGHRDYILDAVGRFRGRIDTWDVINEAHDWANDPRLGPEQLVELTRLAADAAAEANGRAVRIVNSCCTWSEYVARGECHAGDLGRPGRTVLGYLRDCIGAGVDFDVVGLQMYDPSRDLFEIDRHLDMFCRLGKPVHITELGISSSCRPVERRGGLAINPHYWHGRAWSEAEQADWIEGFYAICCAKPAIEAITWWDFCDPAFVPHGGLVDEHLRPKEGYHRLRRLIEGRR